MSYCWRKAGHRLLLLLCLIGHPAVAGARQMMRGADSLGRWERVYAEPGANFKTIKLAPLRLKKESAVSWLWVGDAQGFLRLAVLDPYAPVSLGPQKGSAATYFGLSRLDVTGASWEHRRTPAPVNALVFLDEGLGYLLKGNNLYVTEDAGFSWRVSYHAPNLPDGSVATLFSISVTPSDRACVVGWYEPPSGPAESLVVCASRSLKHDDPQWRRVEVMPRQVQLYNIYFLDDRRGWIVGTKGTILKSDNSGKSWKRMRSGTESLLQTCFVDEKNGWTVGRVGVILRTRNGGDSWDKVRVNLGRGADNVAFRSVGFAPNEQHGWIIGDRGMIFYTDNSGDTWQRQNPPPPDPGGRTPDLNALFVDDDACWVVGDFGAVWRYRMR